MTIGTPSLRVLYLEDNRADAALTRRQLARQTPEIMLETVATLGAALERLALEPPPYDVVLTDLNLSDGTGLQLLAHIRERELPLAVVIITGAGDQAAAVAALNAGADDYLVKQAEQADLPQVLIGARTRFQESWKFRAQRLRVLYAEPNGFDADLTRRSLAQHAPHVTLEVVASGAEILERLPLTAGETSSTCDVLLLDFRLPDLNALEVVKVVRLERGLQIPIVMVTGHGNEELVVQSRRLGVDDYLIKSENYLQQLPYLLERCWKQTVLRQSEARYRLLFEANPHPMWVFDLETLAFLAVNDAAIAHYGYCREEFLAMTLKEIRPADDVPKLLSSPDLDREGLNPAGFWRHRKKDGTLIDVDIRTHTLQFDGRRAKMVLAYDVTEQRFAEQERKKLIDELEKRNAELERFTYTVSHDLKSPLVTILGFIGQLELDLADNEPDNVKADLDFIANAANQMRDLLESLLKLSRAGRAIDESRPIDLPALVRQVVEQIGGRLAHARLQVDIPPELPTLQGDPIRLLEVFQNLLENAAKFTAGQPEPCIEIGCATGEREILCHVRDNGIGVPAEYQEKVFGLFEKLDSTVEGTGVGLAIVRRIVEEHGGRVWVESAGVGAGCTFWFTLPVSAPVV